MKNTTLLVFLLFILVSCNNEKEYDYPLILTGDVTDIDSTGATFNSKIVNLGNGVITEFGFVWSVNPDPTITNSEKYIMQESPELGVYNKRISTTLQKDTLYYVRAYIKNDKYVTYGFNGTFTGAGSLGPIIENIAPEIGNVGDTVVITGKNFSYIQTNNNVCFDGFKASVLRSGQDTIVVIVPEDLNKELSEVKVTIRGRESTTGVEFKLIAPEILDFSPKTATFGSEITVLGSNFSVNSSTLHVYLDDLEIDIAEFSDGYITFLVPGELNSRSSDLTVKVNNITATSTDRFQLESLILTDFNPKVALTGDTVLLTGKNFSPVLTNNIVMVGGIQVTVLDYKEDQLTVVLPLQNKAIYSARTSEFSVEVAGETKAFDEPLEINDQWFRRRNSPLTTIWDARGFVYDGKAYVGLTQTNELYEFDPSANTWTLVTTFPGTARIYGSGFIINDKIYFGTGVTNGLGQYLNDFWEFNLTTKLWTRKNDFIGSARQSATGFSIGTDGYLFGGKVGTSFFNELWKYDYLSDQWTLVAGRPRLTGTGFSYDYNGNHYMCYYYGSTIFCYLFDAINNTWILEREYPDTFSGSIYGFAVSGKLYYSFETGGETSLYKELDLISGELSVFKGRSFAVRPVILPINNVIYFFQGNSNYVWEFDPAR